MTRRRVRNIPMAAVTPALGWDIKTEVIRSGDMIAENYKGLHRDDNGALLNIAKQSYKPMSNKAFTQTVEDMAKITGMEIQGFSSSSTGGVVLGYLQNMGGSKIAEFTAENFMVLGNSHDYSKGFFTGIVNRLMRCENEFSQIKMLQSIRHNGLMEQRIEDLKMYYADYTKMEKELILTFEHWLTKKVSKEDVKYFINELTDYDPKDEKTSTRKINIVNDVTLAIHREMDAMGDNLFAMFNGITYYTTHVKQSTSRVFGNPIGTLGTINNDAYKLATKMEVAL